MSDIIRHLMETIESRKDSDPGSSYTAKLMHAGTDKINRKVLEEAYETAVAALGSDRALLTRELCDLLYHALVLAAHRGVGLADLETELERRSGTSGLAEKASRGAKD